MAVNVQQISKKEEEGEGEEEEERKIERKKGRRRRRKEEEDRKIEKKNTRRRRRTNKKKRRGKNENCSCFFIYISCGRGAFSLVKVLLMRAASEPMKLADCVKVTDPGAMTVGGGGSGGPGGMKPASTCLTPTNWFQPQNKHT